MTYNPLSGIAGSVKISTTAYAFTRWGLQMKCKAVSANNFTGGGYQQVVAGIVSATLSLEANSYDQGNMAFAVGTKYAFVLGYTALVSITVTVLVTEISPTINYEDNQGIKITGESDGSFTAAIT